MNLQEIEKETAALKAENKAIEIKKAAFMAGGSAIAFIVAKNKGAGFWARLGYTFAGATLARIPMEFAYASKLESNKAKIAELQNLKTEV